MLLGESPFCLVKSHQSNLFDGWGAIFPCSLVKFISCEIWCVCVSVFVHHNVQKSARHVLKSCISIVSFSCKAFSFWSNTFLLTPTASKHFVHQIHIFTRIGHVIVEYYNVSDVSANSIQALHGCILKLHNII